jgi:hypothetical protein
MDRQLVLCVLHNIAVIYQKSALLDKASLYVSDLIFNLENSTSQNNSAFMVQIAVYNAQLCALLSQQGEHKKALAVTQRAVSHLRALILGDKAIFMR